MSVRLWAYQPEKCDGDICVNDCDRCPKGEWIEFEEFDDGESREDTEATE